MKNILTHAALAAFIFVMGTTFSNQAQAISVEGAVNKIIDTVIKKAAKSKTFTEKFCRKASFFSGVYSVRSGEGIACKDKHIAAIAEMICVNTEGYEESHCHKNAMKALEGTTPEEAIRGISGNLKSALCQKEGNLPETIKGPVSKACAGK